MQAEHQYKVRIYTTQFCSYCIRARMLLKSKGVEYQELRIDYDLALRQEMQRLSGRHTVPQIWIGDQHIGGFSELSMLEAAGELDNLLS